MQGDISSVETRLHRRFSLTLKILLLLGAAYLAVEGLYQTMVETLIILLITFLPVGLGRQLRVRIPPEFDALAVLFICLTLFFGEALDFYNRYWWWDVALHTGSGFMLGITGFLLVYVLNETPRVNLDLTPGFMAIFAFMFSLGMGVIWEIFEFAMDSAFGLNMQKSGLVDTMWDLIVDLIGALIISVLGYGYLKTVETDSFLERMIDRFVESNPRMFRRHKNKH